MASPKKSSAHSAAKALEKLSIDKTKTDAKFGRRRLSVASGVPAQGSDYLLDGVVSAHASASASPSKVKVEEKSKHSPSSSPRPRGSTGGDSSKPKSGGARIDPSKFSHAQLSTVGYVPFNASKVNQDRAVAHAAGNFLPGDKTKAFYVVMDGHGMNGHNVSSLVASNLPSLVARKPTLKTNPKEALSASFMECNKLLQASAIDCSFSGTTCIAAYVNGKTMYTANAGDSRAVMGRWTDRGAKKALAVALSRDLKPEVDTEKKRILDRGGRVHALQDPSTGQDIGPKRVWLGHQDVPGLAMTRSLGDFVAGTVGVTAEPEVWERELEPEDAFMILASDGVWEFISNQEAVDMVCKCKTAEEACAALGREASRRWRAEETVIDDITSLVVLFHGPSTLK